MQQKISALDVYKTKFTKGEPGGDLVDSEGSRWLCVFYPRDSGDESAVDQSI